MASEDNHFDERTYVIDAIYRIVGQLERKFDALRATDQEAVKLSQAELTRRLEGFPQQYATRVEMEQAAQTLRRLESSALQREVYDQRHQMLDDEVSLLQKDSLPRSMFDTFVENYRLEQARHSSERSLMLPRSVFETFIQDYRVEQERAAAERRDVAEVLAQATDRVRMQILEERGEYLTVESYDQQHRGIVLQVEAVQAWQYKLVGGLVFATFLAPLVTGLVVYIITKGI